MKFAVIAAGEGSRLAAEGISLPKPLVKVNGEPLIDRLIRIFMENDADEIVVICNDHTPLVKEHLTTPPLLHSSTKNSSQKHAQLHAQPVRNQPSADGRSLYPDYR